MTEYAKENIKKYFSGEEEKKRRGEISEEGINNLKEFIKEILTPETTNGTWCPECPEYKQSRTVSYLVQSHLGGEILFCRTKKGSTHYWNLLPNEQEIDLTEKEFEFSGDELSLGEIDIIEIDRVIFSDTKVEERYEILRLASEEKLKERGVDYLWELVLV